MPGGARRCSGSGAEALVQRVEESGTARGSGGGTLLSEDIKACALFTERFRAEAHHQRVM